MPIEQFFSSFLGFLDAAAVGVFAITGALVASRKQMDIFGFALLGTVTGIGGGTVRDVLLGRLPVFWVKEPSYVGIALVISAIVFFLAHIPESRYRRSSPARIDAFREIILRAGLMTVTRKTRGDDIAAACGQLAGQVQQGRRSVPLQVLN
mgnify:CR=1 FL=1